MNILTQLSILTCMVFIIPAMLAIFIYICLYVIKTHSRLWLIIGLTISLWTLIVVPELYGHPFVYSVVGAITSLYASVLMLVFKKFLTTSNDYENWIFAGLITMTIIAVYILTVTTSPFVLTVTTSPFVS